MDSTIPGHRTTRSHGAHIRRYSLPPRRRHTFAHVVVVGTLAVTAVGCGGGTPDVTSDGAQSPASDVAAPSPTSTDAPSPPPVSSSPATSSSAPTSPATSTPTAAEPSDAPSSDAASSETTPPAEDDALPAQAPAEHGGTAVAVYLAVTDEGYDSPPVQQAQAAAADLGYDVGGGDLGCDQGAAEALGVETDGGSTWAAVALYFASVEEAEQVRTAFEDAGHPVEGVAEVTTYCLD